MKLPEDKQQRVKILVMIGLGAALIILGILQGVINPVVKSKREKLARLEEMGEVLRKARADIRRASRLYQANVETISRILTISEDYVLHPALGNYLLGATEFIESCARRINVQTESIHELGQSEIPHAPGARPSVKAYSVRVVLRCGYVDMIRLLRELERRNPFLCVTTLTINGRPQQSPEVHAISFDLQWPVWDNPETPEKLRDQLDETTEWKPADGRRA